VQDAADGKKAELRAVYSAGIDIAYRIRTSDWEGLQPYLAMKP
jgi:hypothetical protein